MCQLAHTCPFPDCIISCQSHFRRPATTGEVEDALHRKWWIRPGVIVRWRDPSPEPGSNIIPDAPDAVGLRMIVRSINVEPSVIDPGDGSPLKCVQHIWVHLALIDNEGQH